MFVYLAYHLTSLMSLPSRRNEEGASAVEYGLLVALIAAFIVGAVTLLGTSVRDIFNGVAAAI